MEIILVLIYRQSEMWLQKITMLKRKATTLEAFIQTGAFLVKTSHKGISIVGVNDTCICFYVCLTVLTRRIEGFKSNLRNYHKDSSLQTRET